MNTSIEILDLAVIRSFKLGQMNSFPLSFLFNF